MSAVDTLHRVDALRLRQHADAAQVERADAFGHLRGDAPLEPDPLVAVLDPLAELGDRQVEHRGEQAPRSAPGRSTVGGVAKTDWSSTEVASSSPLTSVISPRSAGSSWCWASWCRAISASQACSTTCHQTRRAPTSDASDVTTMRRTRARARLSVLASMLVSVRRPSRRPRARSIGGLAVGRGERHRSLLEGDEAKLASRAVRDLGGRAGLPDRPDQLLLLGATLGQRRLQRVDLVAGRRDASRLAQVEERERGRRPRSRRAAAERRPGARRGDRSSTGVARRVGCGRVRGRVRPRRPRNQGLVAGRAPMTAICSSLSASARPPSRGGAATR